MMPGKICILHTYYNSYKLFDKYGHVVYKKNELIQKSLRISSIIALKIVHG